MFDDVLIESAGIDKKKGGWRTASVSGIIHIVVIGAAVAAGVYAKTKPVTNADKKLTTRGTFSDKPC